MQACRPQFLEDQLSLSQRRGADYAHQIILAPRIFRPSYGPVMYSFLGKGGETIQGYYLRECGKFNQKPPSSCHLIKTKFLMKIFFFR